MAEISLAVQQFNAPGTYIAQDFAGALPSGVVDFSAAYLFGEVSESVSTSLTTGIPYNVPILLTDLTDFETRLGNGNQLSFTVPSFGASLDTYNAVKLFFRNAASDVAASLYFIRVKPVGGCELEIKAKDTGVGPAPFVITDNIGVQQTVYGYPIEINSFQIGRVDYDSLGNATHIGVQVDENVSATVAAETVLQAIADSPVGASVYARLDFDDPTVIKLYPRLIGQELFVNGTECSTIPSGTDIALSGGDTPTNYADLSQVFPSDDAIESSGRIEARDYVYSLENALDFTVHPPGFLMAPAAFAKYNPEDRLRVGTAMENRAAAIDYQWFAIVDCAPADGTGIQQHYNYELFDFGDQTNLDGLTEPFFLRETQQFFDVTDPAGSFAPGATGNAGLSTQDVDLPARFSTLYTPSASIEVPLGSVFVALDGFLYKALAPFTPTTVPIDTTDPIGDASNRTGLVERLYLLAEDYEAADLGTLTATVLVPAGTKFSGSDVIGGAAGEIYIATADFTPTVIPLSLTDPEGDASNDAFLVQAGLPIVASQIVDVSGVLYFVRSTYQQLEVDAIPTTVVNSTSVDTQIPLAYYQEWARVNLSSTATNAITPAVYNPTNVDSIILGARSILYNATNHDALAREHLMYTSPFGYLGYYAPYLVDLEGFNVPPSGAVAGTALRRYREQGFQEPPAGVLYALQGVLRPQVNITRAHQQASNPTGLNAIRLLPNQGTVIWGARTRSSNSLFRWVNTRIILNVVINSLRGAFDDKIFRAIDGSQNLFRQIRSTAEGILYVLWQGQALYGASPSQAYRVICNNGNNPDFNIENGLVNVDVYVVPVSTLEVILIRVYRTAIGQLDIVVSSSGQLTGV